MSVNDRKAGLLGLKRLIAKQVPFRTPELKKILESLRGLLSGRGPLLLTALDVLTGRFKEVFTQDNLSSGSKS